MLRDGRWRWYNFYYALVILLSFCTEMFMTSVHIIILLGIYCKEDLMSIILSNLVIITLKR
jgi:hypothetical protein